MSRNTKILVGTLAAGAAAAGATGYYYMRKYRECANGSAKAPSKLRVKA